MHLPHCHPAVPALTACRIALARGLLAGLFSGQVAATKLPGITADFRWYERPCPDHAACLQSLRDAEARDTGYASAQNALNQQHHAANRVWLETEGVRIQDGEHAQYRRTLWLLNRRIDVERALEISQSTINSHYLRCEGAMQLEDITLPAPPGSPGYREREPHELPGARSG